MVKEQYESKRLVLRLSNVMMAKSVSEYYTRNRVFLEKTDPKREEVFFTEEYQREQLAEDEALAKEDSAYRFWIAKKENPEHLIGMIVLQNIIRGAFHSCHMGYKLDEMEQNQGYMTEATKLCIEIAFQDLKLHRIEGNIMPRNLPSRRVVEKLGFQNEGTSRKYLKINGVWEDHIHMVLLNEEMEAVL